MIGWLISLIGKLVPVLDATTRLVRAAKESLRPKPAPIDPPPPIGESGRAAASVYLDGATDEQWRQLERERLAQSAQMLADAAGDEPVESEKPLEEKP